MQGVGSRRIALCRHIARGKKFGQLRRLAVRSAPCLRADWTVPSRPDRIVSWRFSDRFPRDVTRETQRKRI